MGDFLASGEVMLRLSPPGRELLMQQPKLDVWVGGAESSVAIALARLGQDVGYATVLPDNDLGHYVVSVLRGHGIDTGTIRYGGDRIGLNLVSTGADVRDRGSLRPRRFRLCRRTYGGVGLGRAARRRWPARTARDGSATRRRCQA